ncbi:hypothetical protein BDR03DRAFT_987657 [Suillus americanus]|nr:hypothetical protein BDR03DRAFT_987657 [Suillus americanus]
MTQLALVLRSPSLEDGEKPVRGLSPVKKKPLIRRIALSEYGYNINQSSPLPELEVPQTPVPPYHQTPPPVTVSQNYLHRLVADRWDAKVKSLATPVVKFSSILWFTGIGAGRGLCDPLGGAGAFYPEAQLYPEYPSLFQWGAQLLITGTIATAIFGWLDSDQSEEGRMATHLALAEDVRLDPSMGVFDFTDTRSAISLAQFVLGLRTHSQDIKGAISIEAVDSLTPLHWRSDLPDFETQFWGQSDERVASWTHQIHVQTSSRHDEASSSSSPRTPSPTLDTAIVSYETMSSPLLRTIVEDEQVDGANIRLPQETRATNVKGRGRRSRPSSLKNSSKRTSASSQPLSEVRTLASSRASSPYPNSQFAALSDTGLKDSVSISNWLFERHAFTVGRIPVLSKEQANKTGINAMVEIYDKITAFTWSDNIKTILLNATVDKFVSEIRSVLCDTDGDPNCQPSAIDVPSLEDVEFISCRLSALLHAVKGARQCDDVAKLHGANEADRRHEWDALLLNFFQPVPKQRDVLLERQLNSACNLVADDSSFAARAIKVSDEYQALCIEQHQCVPLTPETSGSLWQAATARDQAVQFSDDIRSRSLNNSFAEAVASHSSKDPITGKCDAILVIPCSGFATAVLQHISNIDEQEKVLESFMLVQGPKPEKLDASTGKASHQIENTHKQARQRHEWRMKEDGK